MCLVRADLYPYLLVNIGSGVSMVRVDGEGKFLRVSGAAQRQKQPATHMVAPPCPHHILPEASEHAVFYKGCLWNKSLTSGAEVEIRNRAIYAGCMLCSSGWLASQPWCWAIVPSLP